MNKREKYEEADALRDLRNGSVEAFDHIFNLYWKPLYTLAKGKLRSKEEAEEVVQELFAVLWQKRTSLLIDNLSHYLFIATRNRILKRIRSKMIEEKYWNYYGQFIPREYSGTEETVQFNDVNEAIDEVVDQMPKQTQLIFKRNWQEGKSIPEIAEQLNLSEKAIEYHLTKSIKSLRLHLRKFILSILVLLITGI